MRSNRTALLRCGGLALVGAGFAVALVPGRAAASTPVVTIAPVGGATASGPYQDGETVAVTVKKNSTFTPGTRVNILECADPQGTVANLPKDIGSCDGLTIQADSVLVQPDGAISVPTYTMYRLPSPTLGEQSNALPVCDETDQCVLYVGQDQTDFTQPKAFSSPFTVTSAPGARSASSGAATGLSTSSPTSATALPSASAGDTQASLAFTGTGSWLPWLLAVGGVLVLTGGVGRRWTRVRS